MCLIFRFKADSSSHLCNCKSCIIADPKQTTIAPFKLQILPFTTRVWFYVPILYIYVCVPFYVIAKAMIAEGNMCIWALMEQE